MSAINSAGTGPASVVARATTDPITAPDPPQELAAEGRDNHTIDLSWSAPDDDGGAAISGYKIEVSEDAGSSWSVLEADTDTTDTGHSHSGLSPGDTRHYRVSAINSVGTSEPSDIVNAITKGVDHASDSDLGGTILYSATLTAATHDFNNRTWIGYPGGGKLTPRSTFEYGGETYRFVRIAFRGDTLVVQLTYNVDPRPLAGSRLALHLGPETFVFAADDMFEDGFVAFIDHGLTWKDGETADVRLVLLSPPQAPENLTATANGYTQIDLDWDAPADDGGAAISGYRIEVSADGVSGWTRLVSNTESTDTEYSDTPVADGTTRHYRVSAINDIGRSDPSNIAFATTPATTVATAPTNLTATAVNQSTIALEWVAPDDNGGAAISGYRIEFSIDAGDNWNELVATTGTTDTKYADTGLAKGATRHYRVSAINSVGNSEPSNIAKGIASGPAEAPQSLTATAVSAESANASTQIDLDWDAPADDGGAAITGYLIEVSADGATTWSNLEEDTGSTDTEYSHTNLPPGATRHYRVSAINFAGTSDPSGTASASAHLPEFEVDGDWHFIPSDLGPGAAFRLLFVSAATRDATSSNIDNYNAFVQVAAGSGHAAIQEYSSGFRAVGSTEAVDARDNTATTYTALSKGVRIYWLGGNKLADDYGDFYDGDWDDGAVATNESGAVRMMLNRSAWPYTGSEHDGTKAAAGLTSRALGRNLVKIANPNANASSEGPIGSQEVSSRSETRPIYGLSAVFRVRTTGTVPVAPGAPTDLSATVLGASGIKLEWKAPASDGGAAVGGYRIEWSADGNMPWQVLVGNTDSTAVTYDDTSLSEGTTRHYRVSAINYIGASAPSGPTSATTYARPGAPTGLNATVLDKSRIELDWDAPGDDGGTAITGYRIEVSTNGGTDWSEVVSDTGDTDTSYTHSGLDPGSTRHYRVSAINAVGTSDPSSIAFATTHAPPGAPTGLTAAANGSTRIDLDWDAPDDDGGTAVSGYKIEVSTDGGSNWTALVSNTGTTATNYRHTDLPAGATRHYRISAINADTSAINAADTSAPSSTASASAVLAEFEVDAGWKLVPSGLSPGSTFRLLFLSAGTRDATSSNIDDYNAFVQSAAAAATNDEGEPALIQDYSSGFRAVGSTVAVGSTDAVDARDNTATTYTDDSKGVRIYWLGGNKLADEYEDFYDGDWDDEADAKNESGDDRRTNSDQEWPFTGSSRDGMQQFDGVHSVALGALREPDQRSVRVGCLGAPGQSSGPLDCRTNRNGTDSRPLYGLSAVFRVRAPLMPVAPGSLSAKADGPNRIDLVWSPPASDGGAAISGYRIEVSTDGGSNWTVLVSNTGSTATTYAHTGLAAGTERHYRVSAINTAGAGTASNVASATTAAAGAPGAPTGLTATADGKMAIDLAWTAPADNGGSAISGYRIEVSSDAGSNWSDLVSDTASTATSYAHTNLDPGTTRHYRVSAINTAGTGSASNVAHATTEAEPPGAPTDLTATADGKMEIDLAWTVPDDTGGAAVSGYRIEVSSDAGSNWADLVANTGSTATTYAHTGLSAGTERHYRVSAINTAGTGSASNVAHATTEAEPPGAPTGLTATADGKTAIDLAWTVPDDTGGAAVSGYRIEVSSDAGSNWADLVANTGSTATTYAHTGLAAGTERHYRVSAINTAGAGTASNVVSATTSAAGAPGAPTDLTATADGKMAIDLAWTAPADNGGSAISGYRIEVSSDGGSNWSDLVSDTASTATSYEHTNLDPGTTRHYRVSATNTAGTGSASNVAHATTEAEPPGAPTGLTATADGKTEIDLAWTVPDDTGGAAVSGYRIEVSSDAGSNWADLVANTGSTATTYAHTGLSAGTERHYRVSAINTAGAGTASNVASATTSAAGAPGAPTDLTATADGRTAIDLAWTAPADNGGSAISGYRIEVSSDGGSNWTDLVSDTASTATSYAHTNLDPGTERHYRVSAINTAGTGSASNVAHATTEAEPPGAPTGLTATADGKTAIDLAWTVPDDTGGAAVSGYRIEVSSDAGSNWADLVANTGTTATTYAHTGLAAGTERHYRVSAINTAGTGSASNVVSATTSAAGAPGAPTDLTATADGRTAIDLAWTAPGDNGGSAISGYRIEVSSDGGSNWSDLVSDTASTATSYEHTNLDPGTTRHYRVSAINTAGTGSASNVAHATTDAAPPGAPTGLTVTADGKTEIDLAWTVPDDTGGAAVSGYRIEVSSDAGSNWADLVANTGTTATTYAHTGLAAGTERHYRVSATNSAGTGTASNVVSATTAAAGAPGAPTDLTATADGRTAIDLAWTAPGDNGGSAISGYRIEVSSDGGSNWTDLVSDTASTATSYAHANLDPGTERHYRVSAINTAGTGSASNVAHATTEAEPPGAPTGLSATADGKTAIDLAWTVPDDTGGAAVSGYRIEVSSDAGSNWADLVANTGTTATTYAHTGLAAGTERHYRVSAINTAGTGSASNVVSATTSAAGAPGAPTGLTATADGKMAIDLAWTAPADNGGSAISGYRIEVSSDGGSNWTDLVSDTASTATSYEHTNLDPGTTRHYRVSAINTAGTGPASNVANATTEAEPPGAPTGLSATADGQTAIDLAWTAPGRRRRQRRQRLPHRGLRGQQLVRSGGDTGTTATTYGTPAWRRARSGTTGSRRSTLGQRHHGRSGPDRHGGRADGDRPGLDGAGRQRRQRHQRLPHRGLLRRRQQLDRPGLRHREHGHLLRAHQPGPGDDAALPGVGDQHGRHGQRLQRRPRDDRGGAAGGAHGPDGDGGREDGDRPGLDGAGRHWRSGRQRLPHRGLQRRGLELGRSGGEHRDHGHDLRAHRPGGGHGAALPGVGDGRDRHGLQRGQRHHGRCGRSRCPDGPDRRRTGGRRSTWPGRRRPTTAAAPSAATASRSPPTAAATGPTWSPTPRARPPPTSTPTWTRGRRGTTGCRRSTRPARAAPPTSPTRRPTRRRRGRPRA